MLRRVEIPVSEFAADRVLTTKGTVPVLEERDVWGLAIAPESVVRGVLVQAQTGRNRNQLVTLVDGAPITWSESKADIRIHPLDYTTGILVLLVATQESDLRLLPTNVATRAVCAMSGQLSGKKVRLHRPRGLVHAWGRWTLVVSPPAFDEFDTLPEYTIREWHLDENREISAKAISIVKRNATPVELGVGATIQDTLAEFAGDVLELEFNDYTESEEPMRFVLSVSGWNDVARDSEGGGGGETMSVEAGEASPVFDYLDNIGAPGVVLAPWSFVGQDGSDTVGTVTITVQIQNALPVSAGTAQLGVTAPWLPYPADAEYVYGAVGAFENANVTSAYIFEGALTIGLSDVNEASNVTGTVTFQYTTGAA